MSKPIKDKSLKFADRDKEQVVLEPQRRGDEAQLRDAAGRLRPVQAEQFPTTSLRADEDEDQLNLLKLQLADDKGQTPYGQIQWSDKAGRWLLRKQRAAQRAAFEDWFAKMYDKADDVHKKWARERFPSFYAGRMKALEENLDTLGRLARIKIGGVKSTEDLYLKYAAETGMIDMKKLQKILYPEEAGHDKVREFKRGLLNPKSWAGPRDTELGLRANATEFDRNIGSAAWQGLVQPVGDFGVLQRRRPYLQRGVPVDQQYPFV